ncbi:MAG: thioredoxin family protein [Chloroflexi bacterium]|nr:thioredoxin family protein [Chloroflexota bacterium]
MVTIKVFGTIPPCAKCKRAEQEALKAAQEFPGQVQVVKLDALGPEAEPYGLMSTPTIVVEDQVVARGKVARAQELATHIAQYLKR